MRERRNKLTKRMNKLSERRKTLTKTILVNNKCKQVDKKDKLTKRIS